MRRIIQFSTLAFAAIAGIIMAPLMLQAFTSINMASDFSVYYYVTKSVLQLERAEHPYVNYIPFPPFIYQPPALIIFWPLLLMPYYIAKIFWTILTVTLTVFSVYLINKINFKQITLLFWPFIILVGLFHPFGFTIRDGQFNVVLLTLYTAALYLMIKGKNLWAGILLGVGVVTKVSPAIIVLFEMLKRNLKLVIGSILAVGLLFLAAEFFVQPGINYYYARHVVKDVASQSKVASYRDQSILNVIKGFDTRELSDFEIAGFEIGDTMFKSLVNYSIVGVIFLIFLLTLFKKPASKETLVYDYSFLMILGVIGTGLAWYHHFTMFLLPIFMIACIGLLATKRTIKISLISISIFCYFIMFPNIEQLEMFMPELMVHNNLLVGSLIMMATFVYLRLTTPKFIDISDINLLKYLKIGQTTKLFITSILVFIISISLYLYSQNINVQLAEARDVSRMRSINYMGSILSKYKPTFIPGETNSIERTHKLDEGFILFAKNENNKVREDLSILLLDPINNSNYNFKFIAHNEKDFTFSAKLESEKYKNIFGEIYTYECFDGECEFGYEITRFH